MSSMTRQLPPLTQAEQQCVPGAGGRMTIRLGTRASALATAQATWVADQLRAAGHEVTLVPVRTEGDTSRASLREIGGTGVFAAALRSALLEERIDIAVHSLKDLPVAPIDGLVIAAIPPREDARDAVVSAGGVRLQDLPAGAVVGTGSPRRAAQLALIAPQLQVRDIRGNVETRIRMVTDGRLDAVVLAYAGLRRLGLTEVITEVLDLDRMLPAPGQGALAVECRTTDPAIREAIGVVLEDPQTRRCVEAERLLLATLEAGCTAPIGAGARMVRREGQDLIEVTAFAEIDGRSQRHTLLSASEQSIAAELAERFLGPEPSRSRSSLASAEPPAAAQAQPPPAASRTNRPENHGSKQPEREK